MERYNHLTLAERVELKIVLGNGESLRGVACRLGRAVSTISRELRRSAVESTVYDPEVALGRARARDDVAAVLPRKRS